MKSLNWKTILAGFVLYLVTFGVTRWLMYHDPTLFLARVLSGQLASTFYTCFLVALSTYVAAGRKADSAMRNSGICGALIVLSVVYSAATSPWIGQHEVQSSAWLLRNLPFFGEVFLFTVLGGYLRLRHNLKVNRVLDPLQPPIPLP